MIAAITTWADVALCVGIVAFFAALPLVLCRLLCREADWASAEEAGKNWPPPQQADAQAIKSDWQAVGNDMRQVMGLPSNQEDRP